MKQIVGALLFCLLCTSATAQLHIEITRGVDDPVPIAVVPFGWQGGSREGDIARIIQSNLHRSGQFAPVDRGDMLSTPNSPGEVVYRDWRALATDYVVVGRTEASGDNLRVDYALLDVHGQREMLTGTMTGRRAELRGLAHAISDEIYERLTNIRGAFSTRLLYVSAVRDDEGEATYRLIMSDIDGERERVLLEQDEPIMTPSWAPNGRVIAYVSFETRLPAIYLHNVETGQRRRLTDFPGINGAPAWSPDGRRLAMVLSKDGSPNIYVMNIDDGELTQVTRHFAIDTEPDWMPDGESVVFTSDRGGRPQIYRAHVETGDVERLTFEGSYNARARVLPEGEGLVMVHRRNGNYHIATQDFRRNRMQVLTETQHDESPSVAPNGSMLLYATTRQGQGVLAAVSIDGSVQYLLPSEYGDVREPAWSPFLD